MVFDLFDDRPRRKTISKDYKEALFARQKGRCMYCGKKDEMGRFHIDHKTPFSRNGSDRLANLQLLCGPCNTRKGDLTDGEFRKLFSLTPARQVKGPPTRAIPLKYFEAIAEEISTKKATKRRAQRRNEQDDWNIFGW